MAHPEPGDRPPSTRLERPPGERYASPGAAQPVEPVEAGRPVTPARGVWLAAGAALIGAAASVVLAGVLAVSLGLLVVALLTGWLVAEGLRTGAGDSLEPARRRPAAGAIALAGIAAGQLGIWLYARAEGGALGLIDYLWQTFGWVVPAQLVIAAAAAWWNSR